MPRFLTSSQLKSWQQDGFLVVPDMVDPAQTAILRAQAATLVDELRHEWDKSVFSTRNQEQNSNAYFLESGDRISIFMEETAPDLPNKLGHALHEHNAAFHSFAYQKTWGDIAEDLGFEQPGLLQSMYIFKRPHVGGPVSAHQDSAFLYTEPLSVVGFWFAMEDAHRGNACLWALPGGHREALRRRFVREGDSTRFEVLDQQSLPNEGFIALEAKAGSLVLLHGQLPHGSDANTSGQSREAFTLHVIEQKANYPTDNWLQRPSSMPLQGFHTH